MDAIIRTAVISLFIIIMTQAPASATAVADSASQTGAAVQTDSFMSDPARGLADIYRNYHDWKIDAGIELALRALSDLQQAYGATPEAVIPGRGLRLNKAYQIESTLHTLLGMLYYRKSMLVLRQGGDEAMRSVLSKLEDGQELTDADLEMVASEAEAGGASNAGGDRYIKLAIAELEAASRVEPANPSPHYQLAVILSATNPGSQVIRAEKEFFIAAELSLKENRKADALKALQAIRDINPESDYAARLQKMVAN